MNNCQNLKHVIIAVIGMTPQIITETLWALVNRSNPIIPHSIFIITTSGGKHKAIQTLLNGGKGKFYQFCREYELDASCVEFDESTIFTVRNAENRQLEDIRTNADNEAISNFIVNFVREKAEDPDTIIHASAAGGRKTMSIYLAYALSLFGRKQDRLYHVLISPPELENHPEFFYIPHSPVILTAPDSRSILTSNASVEIAEIPFIRLREKIEKLDFEPKISYSDWVKQSQCEVDLMQPLPEIVINDTARTITINGEKLSLDPLEWAVYRTFLEQKMCFCSRPEIVQCDKCTDCFMDMPRIRQDDYLDRIFNFYALYIRRSEDQIAKSRESSNSDKWHREKISDINKKIREQVKNNILAEYCTIQSIDQRPMTRYGIRNDKNKILIHSNTRQ